jgi:hypothetical protein
MIVANSYKFITLEKNWELWIGQQLRQYIEQTHVNYFNIPVKYRETEIWLITDVQNTTPLLHIFSKRWISTLWQSEEELLSFMKTAEEMLYIIQYVQDKCRYRIDLNLCNIIEKFTFYFTKDLLIKENKYVTHSLQYYINVNMSRLKHRKKMGALCLNRIRGFDANINQHILGFLN